MSYRDRFLVLVLLLGCLLPVGCNRRQYRLRADRDAYCLLTEKTLGTPWQVPNDFSVYPDPQSRLADPTDPDWPLLPPPGPTLYGGTVTDLVDGEGTESVDAPPQSLEEQSAAPSGSPADENPPAAPTPPLLPNLRDQDAAPVPSSRRFDEPPSPGDVDQAASLRRFPSTRGELKDSEKAHVAAIQLVNYQQEISGEPPQEPLPPPEPRPALAPQALAEPAGPATADDYQDEPASLVIQAIPAEYWNVLPPSCLRHMLEFPSVREEFVKTFGDDAPMLEQSLEERASLREIVDLARLNSREYQTRKEQLYVSALDVSLERFDYQLRFTPRGNGTEIDYTHNRFNGETINTLGIGTTFGVERMLATGGNFLARFANQVLLTFNGPQGFTADVSSELFFELTQAILQRDILLEPLIQSERTLVYTAREFARFRKEFFFDIASRYYGLLSTYRRIEIESQNYFSLVRTLEQAQAEVRAAVKNAPNQVAVDQFEQGMLSGRSDLIARSNALDQGLDQLKLALGLPTDMPLEIDLEELRELTLLDETEVSIERVRRWRTRVVQQRSQVPLPRVDLLNDDVFLIERLLDWIERRETLDRTVEGREQLQAMYLLLRQEQARSEAARTETEYLQVSNPELRQPPILIYLRGTGWLEDLIRLIDRQVRRLEALPSEEQPSDMILDTRRAWADLLARLNATRSALAENPTAEQLDELIETIEQLLAEANELVRGLDDVLGNDPNVPESVKNEVLLEMTDELLDLTEALIGASDTGLPEVEIDVDDAMVTALIQRLDMMNERGFLADDWRRVKLAADDLRSVLNLSASHSLRTDRNQPFDFDFDDSRTNLGLTFDLPFNRRAQRNNYRASLFAYQAGRRSVMQLEDNIKFDIRNGLRNLELTRVQYPISVTRAALAAEQVISIRLQLALGTPDVRGRDLIDALQASREALTSVADSRIGYLVDRARFVLDLELMQLNEDGFWPQINDPSYQPNPDFLYPPTAGPTYGVLSPCVKPSKLMYHIYGHPVPGQVIERVQVPE